MRASRQRDSIPWPNLSSNATLLDVRTVKPNLAPLSYVSYEGSVRLYIAPHLGSKRLDRLTVRDVREWVTKLSTVCQCWAQGKDAKRTASRQRCCVVGECRESYPSRRVIQAARDALRAALTHAVSEELISKNSPHY